MEIKVKNNNFYVKSNSYRMYKYRYFAKQTSVKIIRLFRKVLTGISNGMVVC